MKRVQQDLRLLLASVDDTKEAGLLLEALFTKQECDVLAERWQIVQALAQGTSQRKIAEKLGVGIATITRGSLALKKRANGFQYFLRKLGKV